MKRDPTARPRIFILGTPEQETNARLREAWSRLGAEVELVPARAARALMRPGDIAVARLDVTASLDGVEPGLFELLLLEQSPSPAGTTAGRS